MKYENIIKAKFINRINRFVAEIEIGGKREICHVKNTGRCRELLLNGADIFVQQFPKESGRKTLYDLICVIKNGEYINIDSQAPNSVFAEFAKTLFGKNAIVRREVKYKNSRFDFYIETQSRKIFAEVKGVTLEEDGICRFPDAPTERGIKHLNELCDCIDDGYEAYVIFVIQMNNVKKFEPNINTHFEFGKALYNAHKKGVKVLCFSCNVSKDFVCIDKEVKADLRCDIYGSGKDEDN